jgi:predicted RNA-binding Zn-ribbon protein involved in translation (DUF1610 family)
MPFAEKLTYFTCDLLRRRSGLKLKETRIADGLRYVYLEGGQGERLLLLHGVTPFECPNCGVQYKLVRVEMDRALSDEQLACRKCGGTASQSRRQVHSQILPGGWSPSKGSRAAHTLAFAVLAVACLLRCRTAASAKRAVKEQLARMPRKRPKLIEVRARVAEARRIVDIQYGLVERLRAMGKPTLEAEETQRASALSGRGVAERKKGDNVAVDRDLSDASVAPITI